MNMSNAARAIIIEGDKMLVMHRNKHGSQYFTLVGGAAEEGETPEQTLVREVKEETGFVVTKSQFVFYEDHSAPYNQQYIFLCDLAPHDKTITIQDGSDESQLNRLGANTHTPMWVDVKAFGTLAFRTPQLQDAIIRGIKKGFPTEAIRL
jgi:ADP-ribose pyrophosphatase YjhB (NUDIX family)